MLGLKQIKANGEIVDLGRKPLTLKEAQTLIASGTDDPLIEYVRLRTHPEKFKVGGEVMVVHESGLLLSLPFNPIASEMTKCRIVGDVIIIENEAADFQ